jgi:hypothetical protein
MEKIIIPSSWDFGEHITQRVKYSSKGLIGSDYSVLVKRAGEETAYWLKNIKVAEDQIPVHVIAMGATEGYGPNRNGDGFKEAALMAYHDTFVKYAKHYRHHKNKDPKIRYGSVKASFYNKPMKRVELLTLLNASEKAAEKYGGYFADKELDLVEQGKDIPVSMACKVAYDECSGCGNKAKTRDDYCTDETCKYGGCRDNLTKVAHDGHVLHVDNPHPTFFDISTVTRPADRIAYGNVAAYMKKAASYEDCKGGAALAELYNVVSPPEVWAACGASSDKVARIKLAFELAVIEDTIESNQSKYQNVARAFSLDRPEIDLSPLGNIGTEKFAMGLRALADQDILLPVRDFLRLHPACSGEKLAEACAIVPDLLPGVYTRMTNNRYALERATCADYLDWLPSQKLASATQRNWASKLAEHYSVDSAHVHRRMVLSSIRSIPTPTLLKQATYKTASSRLVPLGLAGDYAMYKLAYLVHKNIATPFARETVVLQNYIS